MLASSNIHGPTLRVQSLAHGVNVALPTHAVCVRAPVYADACVYRQRIARQADASWVGGWLCGQQGEESDGGFSLQGSRHEDWLT